MKCKHKIQKKVKCEMLTQNCKMYTQKSEEKSELRDKLRIQNFLRILSLHSTILTFHTILNLYFAILSSHFTILTFFSEFWVFFRISEFTFRKFDFKNSEFTSHNYDFFLRILSLRLAILTSKNCETKRCNYLFFKIFFFTCSRN